MNRVNCLCSMPRDNHCTYILASCIYIYICVAYVLYRYIIVLCVCESSVYIYNIYLVFTSSRTAARTMVNFFFIIYFFIIRIFIFFHYCSYPVEHEHRSPADRLPFHSYIHLGTSIHNTYIYNCCGDCVII